MLWIMRRIWRAAYKAVKMPMTRLHSSNWDPEDHAHVCLAARLLEPDDFHEVCPLPPGAWIESEDPCDECPYFAIVEFDTSTDGKRSISIYTRGSDWQP